MVVFPFTQQINVYLGVLIATLSMYYTVIYVLTDTSLSYVLYFNNFLLGLFIALDKDKEKS